jgi:benzoylformate decarboxylase
LRRRIKTNKPDSFYTFASGGLGWDMPAAVGLAIAEKRTNRNRPVIAVIGDGSFQYCVQSIYTGVQQNAHVIFIVLRNEEYAVLKEFAVLEKTPNVPWLDLPGINITSLGKGYGAAVANASTKQEIESAFKEALKFKGTSIIEIPITKGLRPLLD